MSFLMADCMELVDTNACLLMKAALNTRSAFPSLAMAYRAFF